jgi:hypothetical protein
VDVKTGITGEAATAATGEAVESMAGKAMDMSKSEGPMAEPKESKPRTGESSRVEKGLEEMEDSSLERAAKDRSAASHSSKPLTALEAGATNMSLTLSTRPDAFLPKWARADSKESADFDSLAFVVSNMEKSTARTIFLDIWKIFQKGRERGCF